MKIFVCCLVSLLLLDVSKAYRLPSEATAAEDLTDAVERSGADENEDYIDVTSMDQLWRYQLGHGYGLNVGDSFICLITRRDTLVKAFTSYLGVQPYDSESYRFEVEFLQGNEVNLKSYMKDGYVSCANDGSTRITDWKDDSAIFKLRISADENSLILHNPAVEGTLALIGESHISCNGFESDPGSKFSGWKLGPRQAWEASDEWQMVGYFDNRYSGSYLKFDYVTSVGVEITRAQEADTAYLKHSRSSTSPRSGDDLYETFTQSIPPDTDVAWKSTPPNVWDSAKTFSGTVRVPPHTLTKFYQAVGHYGIYTIRTNYLRAREEKNSSVKYINLLE